MKTFKDIIKEAEEESINQVKFWGDDLEENNQYITGVIKYANEWRTKTPKYLLSQIIQNDIKDILKDYYEGTMQTYEGDNEETLFFFYLINFYLKNRKQNEIITELFL